MEERIVGVRFKDIGKVYHFNAVDLNEVQIGDFVIVKTSRGTQVGEMISFIEEPEPPTRGTWKKLIRIATPSDLIIRQQRISQEEEITKKSIELARNLKLEDVKIVTTEINFEGDLLTILYNIEGEEDVDLSGLKKELIKVYKGYKIDFRRLGPRDVAKIIGGMGACGIERRCCSVFLSEFSPISIKMAKAQNISLDPTEITGMCGRLRCCLIYEYEHYVEARKLLPKKKKKVVTPEGVGIVLDVRPLTKEVIIRLSDEDRTIVTYDHDEIEPWKELEAVKQKASRPCNHANGECYCGKMKMEEKDE